MNLLNKIHESYYPMMAAIYVLSIFFIRYARPGIAAGLYLAVSAVSISLMMHRGKAIKKFRTEDIVAFAWFLYGLISMVWSAIRGMPPGVWAGEFMTSVLPVIFYFPGRFCESKKGFFIKFLVAVFVIGIVGLIFYIIAPQFYIDFLYNKEYISKADAATSRVRMYTPVGSTVMGYLGVAAMCVSSHFIFGENSANGGSGAKESPASIGSSFNIGIAQDKGSRGSLLGILAFFLSLFLSFMSNQRSAMVAAIFVLLYVNLLIFFVFKSLPRKFFYIECIGLAAGFLALLALWHGAFMKVYYRLISLPGAIGQRSDQWVGAANNMVSIWLGNGLGANGHRAIDISEHIIADGGLAKLYVENGIIGTSIFIFLLLLIFKKAKGGLLRFCAPEIGVIIITLLTAIGSDTLSFALSTPIFYFCIGSAAKAINGKSLIKGEEA